MINIDTYNILESGVNSQESNLWYQNILLTSPFEIVSEDTLAYTSNNIRKSGLHSNRVSKTLIHLVSIRVYLEYNLVYLEITKRIVFSQMLIRHNYNSYRARRKVKIYREKSAQATFIQENQHESVSV